MTSYRYIGYGVTNSNGVAHLDHDPQGNPINGYTGIGAGEVDVLASTDNPITDSSIVSGTLSVLDVVKIYSAIADYYQNASADLSLTDGVFTKTTGNVMPLNPSSSTRFFTTPQTFEFDAVNTDTLTIQIGESSNVFNRSLSTLGATNGSHVKIIYDGTTITPFVDGVEKTSYKVSFTHTTQYYLNMYQSGSWKNFVIY